MRLKAPALLCLTLAVLLGSSGIARAAEDGVVTDEGSNIYTIDASAGPIPNILPGPEVEKIAMLQSAGIARPSVTEVSPDDQTVIAFLAKGTGFLNIHDGSVVPIRGIQGVRSASQISNFFWLDNDTLAFYAITPDPYIVLLGVDRNTGVGHVLERTTNLTNIPVFVSPNGNKVLLITLPQDALEEELALTLPISNNPDPTNQRDQALINAGMIQPLKAGSQASRLAAFAQMFDSLLDGVAAATIGATISVGDRETGDIRPVVTLEKGFAPIDVSFSQDGSKFSLITEGYRVDRARGGRDGALLSDFTYRDATGNLPPSENPWLQGNTLINLDFNSGEVKTIRAADGNGDVFSGVSWSTDNQTLLAKMQSPGRVAGRTYPVYYPQYRSGSSLRFYDSSFNVVRNVARSEISDSEAAVTFLSPDEVLIQSQNRLDHRPYYYNWRSGEFRDLADRAGTYSFVVSTRQSRELVFIYDSFTNPPDVYRVNWDGSTFSRLTWTSEELRQYSQTKEYPVSFTLRNRASYSGVLILPADAPFPPKKMPIVVWQEGGPTGTMENKWSAIVENPFALLPNFGMGVLVVPLYGRYGIGAQRFNALVDNTNYGQVDIDAMNEIVGQMRSKGWASKVGITGCSYGGYFVTQSITRHPNTYDAAHTMCSLVDMVTEWSRGYASLAPWMEGLPPANAINEYRRDSPLYNVGSVKTPLLAFHGKQDFLPVTVMENFMLQVVNNKVPAKMLKFESTGHGLPASPFADEYELFGAQEQISWFRTYLMQ